MLNNKITIKEEAKILIKLTKRALISDFNKSIVEADALINQFNMEGYLIKTPVLLHDSPYDWAIRLLTLSKDVAALSLAL